MDIERIVELDDSVGETWSDEAIRTLADALLTLRASMLELESAFSEELAKVPGPRRASARNLLHYVALRQHDVRPLQEQLVRRGLSSLGRCESHVMANIESILEILRRVSGASLPTTANEVQDFRHGRKLIERATHELFGTQPDQIGPHVMVTMPGSAADDYGLVRELVASGMDVMRINCAHDDATSWARMIGHLRQAERELNRSCRVAMDLAGPKIRTSEIEPGPAVVHWRPVRDSFGRVIAPALIWLHAADRPVPAPTPADAVLPLEPDLLSQLRAGDKLCFHDAAKRVRKLRIRSIAGLGAWAESSQTTYVVPGLELRLRPAKSPRNGETSAPDPASRADAVRSLVSGRVGPISPIPNYLNVYKGDRLLLTDPRSLGRPAVRDDRGQLMRPGQIGCTMPEILPDLRRGERILFDDGKIGGVVEDVHGQHVVVDITRARRGGEKLRADKGINLPDSDLGLPALTAQDIADLDFIVKHADMVSYSFVRRVEDVRRLQAELARLNRPGFPIVLKIETRQAFENLPKLLLAVMSNTAGVMIARGDLAVECGYERLAEIQEEILWMCEAAHLPVVWATQVLETMAKSGIPSRAEVTDAASAVRAECVMLNKGPFIVEAVRALADILQRMRMHQVKKRPMLRKLRLAEQMLPICGVHVERSTNSASQHE
jgi:pyruvate kinase